MGKETMTKHWKPKELKAREEEWEAKFGNSAWEFLGNEIHLFVPQRIERAIITRNGQRFVIDLPAKPLKRNY